MAIELRLAPLEERSKLSPNLTRTLTFSGASYMEHPRQITKATRNEIGAHDEVTLVRFTTPRPTGKGSETAEFVGVLGQTVAAALLRRDSKKLDERAISILSRAFSPGAKGKTQIGVTFVDGKLSLPRGTRVDIETIVDLGLR